MNRKEWKEFCKIDSKTAYFWYNKARKKLLSKEFESDERTDLCANTIHHLQETEEQRKYNDEHYEMFGFELDENGNEHFEYGKYVVFWTKEHHNTYHHESEYTRKKLGDAIKRRWQDKTYREANSGENHHWYGKHHSEESIKKMSDAKKQYYKDNPVSEETRERISKSNKGKHTGENNPMYGKRGSDNPLYGIQRSDEVKKKISESKIGYHHTEESKKKMRDSHKLNCSGENAPWFGKSRSEDTKKKISSIINNMSSKYHEYKLNGGTMTWCEFQHYMRISSSGVNDE